MGRRYRGEYEDKESFTPWETYSDLYCGLLLVFVLLFFFAIYQYIDARERNNAETAELQNSMREEQASVLALYKADLEDQEAAYQEKSRQLDSQKTALAIMQSDLEERTELLNEQQELIDSQEKQMKEQQKALREQEKKLDGQEQILNEQEQKLSEQEQILSEQQRELDEKGLLIRSQQEELNAQQSLLESQAVQIEQIVGIRGQLIEELNRELTANKIQIQADRATGAIAFASTVLFARDNDELSEEGKAFFRSFMPVYMEVLLQDRFRDHIAEIIIEGHTDDSGSYLHNLELSQNRAGSVAEYILNDDGGFLDGDTVAALKSLITVNGCADRDLICQEDGTIDADKSRRVEIKFRLKDQEMIQEMDQILRDES